MECAQLFNKRLQRMMKEWVHIKGGTQKGIFGRVQDYVIRYEVQNRGCAS